MAVWNAFSGGNTVLIHYDIKYPPWSIQFVLFHAEKGNVSLSKHKKIPFQKNCRHWGRLTSNISFYQHWKGFLSFSWRLYQFLCVYYGLYLQFYTKLHSYLNKCVGPVCPALINQELNFTQIDASWVSSFIYIFLILQWINKTLFFNPTRGKGTFMAKLESRKQQKVGSNRYASIPSSFPTKITIITIIKVNIWPTLQFASFQIRFSPFFFSGDKQASSSSSKDQFPKKQN